MEACETGEPVEAAKCPRCSLRHGRLPAGEMCGGLNIGPAEDTESPEPPALTVPMEPYFDKILVLRDPDKATFGTTGLAAKLVVSEHHQDAHKQFTGTVLEVGFGRLRPDGSLTPLHTKPGDRVVFAEFAGKQLPDDFGERIYVLREDEILGRLRG